MTAALRALLDHAVDYAGLFPPAELPMHACVERYAGYRADPRAWMLGRFVVPGARLGEFAHAATPLLPAAGDPWRLSVVLSADADADVAAMAAFNASHGGALCDAAEARAASAGEVERIARAVRTADLATYVEIPLAPDPAGLLDAIASHGLRAKIRTGGITADAFPAPADVVRVLAACVRGKIPFKATAGLHHPVRGDYRLTYDNGAASGTMHGFLNILLAAALLRDGESEQEVTALLKERDSAAFRFADDGVRWRGHFMLTPRLAQLRARSAIAFGSCSFAEPLDDLTALKLL